MRNSCDWNDEPLRAHQRNLLKRALEANPAAFQNKYSPEVIEQNIYNKAKNKAEYLNTMNKILNSKQVRQEPVAVQQGNNMNQMQSGPSIVQARQQQQMPMQMSLPISNNMYQNQQPSVSSIQQTGFQRTNLVHQNRLTTPSEHVRQQAGPSLVPATSYGQRPQEAWPQHQQQQQQYRYNNSVAQPARVNQQQPPQQNIDMSHQANVPGISPTQGPIISNSPGLKTPGSTHSAPSPASLSMNAVPSPANLQQPPASVDDKVYMDKLKQLQKYIEPLSRVIRKFNEDEEKHNKDYLKMKNLRDTLMNPQKRIPWPTLEKCEKVLQCWLENKPAKAPVKPPVSPHQHMCQSIFNTIGNATKFPLLSHTLKRTFGPSVSVLCGDYSTPDVIPNKLVVMQEDVKRMEEEEGKSKMPREVIRELTRLRSKYRFRIDRNWIGANHASSNIHFLCYLVDHKLPAAIPPVRISLPRDYPDAQAEWICTTTSDIENPQAFHDVLLASMRRRQGAIEEGEGERSSTNKHYISSILNSWELSIKEACATLTTN